MGRHNDARQSGAIRVGEPHEAPLATDSRPRSMEGVIGASDAMVDVYGMVDRVADTQCTVLVTGESGTGKELVARAVHNASPRASHPFVAVNCGAIPEALLESELFGHMRGAFTGAVANKIGRVGAAQGGTLFLDEVGELPLSLQVKLLRLLQSYEYSPVGESKTLKADIRIVAATNIDLEEAVAAGKFREDLYYRLNVIHLQLPPLRERKEDLALLIDWFVGKTSSRIGRTGELSNGAIDAMMAWHWPGNVRELENTIERALLLCRDGIIEARDLPGKMSGLSRSDRSATVNFPDGGVDLRNAVNAFENNLIRQALERTGWNKNQAARLLGINRTTLVEMLKRKRMGGVKAA